MSDWGTTAPALNAVEDACKYMETQDLDVSTITVLLDNGGWRVTILATDEDLEDASAEFWLDNHGGGTPLTKEQIRRTV